jgi:hypothetical protein
MRAKYLLIPLAALLLQAVACNGPMTGKSCSSDPGLYSTKGPGGTR